ncbi:MAG: hypothetical protein AAF696_10935 [Bacteroidota bacterium]
MSETKWTIISSNKALDFISKEYNKLDNYKDGLGERFYDRVEEVYARIKDNPLQFEKKTEIYRKGLVNVGKKIQYAIYFRIEENEVYVDLILPTSINPDFHPSD